VALVVVRRAVVNREQRPQRQQLTSPQIGNMLRNQIAEQDTSLVGHDVERTVVLSQTFVEPERRRLAHHVVDQQVHVLMEDYAKGLRIRGALGAQSNVVDVFAGLKITDLVLF